MLLNDLYSIQSLTESDHQIQATVKLMADHAIFKGHFPGQPVLPGVCMMEMISEITGLYMQQPFRISGGQQIKFLHMIDPQKNPLIQVDIKYHYESERTTINGKIFFGPQIFMKFQMILIPQKKP